MSMSNGISYGILQWGQLQLPYCTGLHSKVVPPMLTYSPSTHTQVNRVYFKCLLYEVAAPINPTATGDLTEGVASNTVAPSLLHCFRDSLRLWCA